MEVSLSVNQHIFDYKVFSKKHEIVKDNEENKNEISSSIKELFD
jgi:hypothetical protein